MKRSGVPSKSNGGFKVPWKNDESSPKKTTEPVLKKKKILGGSPLKPKVIYCVYYLTLQQELDLTSMSIEELEKENIKKMGLLKSKQKEYDILKKKMDDLQEEIDKKSKNQVGNIDGKLEKLTEKWIKLCQDVLVELQAKATTPTPIGQMIAYFGIEVTLPLLFYNLFLQPTLLRYKEDTDGF
jgi:hypothetical protein